MLITIKCGLGLSIDLIYLCCSSFSFPLPHTSTTRNSLHSNSLMLQEGLCEGVWGGRRGLLSSGFLDMNPPL